MSALLPCPFCGGTPEIIRKGNEVTPRRAVTIKCPSCRAERTDAGRASSLKELEEVAIGNWNCRNFEPRGELGLARAAFENEGWGDAAAMSAHQMVRRMAEVNTLLRAEAVAVIQDLIETAGYRATDHESMDSDDLADARAFVAKYKPGANP